MGWEKFVDKKSTITDLVSNKYKITIELNLMESNIIMLILIQFIYIFDFD